MEKKSLSQRKIIGMMSFIICSLIVLLSGCFKKDEATPVMTGNPLQPKLPAVSYSYRNGDDNLATLGRILFYDKNLSLNNAVSCGSCHIQSHSFADKTQFSRGMGNDYSIRNASTLISNGREPHSLFWDGRAGNYDTAVFMPVMNENEMNMFNLNSLPEKLSLVSYYPELFQSAFGTPEVNVYRIRTALSSFVANLYSNNSKFDKGDLNEFERLGWQTFQGKGRCYSCHNGDNFNGYTTEYENIGLEINYADKGRGAITNNPADDGKFKVPSLRNIALSAPYMHDGRYKTLREVIDHYSDAVQNSANLSWVFRNPPQGQESFPFHTQGDQGGTSSSSSVPINLTETEKKNLEAFLNTLTDESFVTDPKFSNPF